MLSWGLVPAAVRGTPRRSSFYTIVLDPRAVPLQELESDSLEQGGVAFPAFCWKPVWHFQAHGTYLISSERPADWGVGWVSGAGSNAKYFSFANGCTVWRGVESGKPWVMAIYSIVAEDDADYCYYAVQRMVFTHPSKAQYRHLWTMSSGANNVGNYWFTPGYLDDSQLAAFVPHLREEYVLRTSPVSGGVGERARFSTWYDSGNRIAAVSASTVRARIQHVRQTVIERSHAELYSALETLHATSFDSLQRFDGNLVLLLSKLVSGIGTSTLKSFAELATSEGDLRDIASFWLSSTYGDRLSASGLAELVRSLDREFLSVGVNQTIRDLRGQSRRSYSSIDEDGLFREGYVGSQIAVRPKDYNALMRSIRLAYEWDWFPSMSNVWDAIPLSFVVDWFVNVGDIYRSVDRMVASRYYDVSAVLNTVKASATSPLTPGVEYQYYERTVDRALHLSVASVEFGLPSAVNCINGAALLL